MTKETVIVTFETVIATSMPKLLLSAQHIPYTSIIPRSPRTSHNRFTLELEGRYSAVFNVKIEMILLQATK